MTNHPIDGAQESRRYWEALIAGRRTIAATILLGLLVAAVHNTFRPVYEATAIFSIREASRDPVNQQPRVWDANRLAELVNRYSLRVTDPDLLQEVASGLGPSARADLAQGPLRTLSDQIRAEWRLRSRAAPTIADSGVVDALAARIEVFWRQPTTWVEIRAQARSPQLAAAIANQVVNKYVVQAQQQARAAAEESAKAVEAQLEARQEQLDTQLGGTKEIAIESGLGGDVETRKTLLQQQVQTLQGTLLTAQTNRSAKESALAALENGDARASLAHPRVAAAADRVSDIEERLAGLSASLGERHPDVVALKDQLEAAERRLEQARIAATVTARADRDAAEAEERRVQLSLSRARAEIASLDDNSLEYLVSKKKAEATKAALDSLIFRRENALGTVVQIERVREATTPSSPTAPRRTQNLINGFGLGLLGGILLVLLRDGLNSTVRSPDDVQLIGLRALGVVSRRKTISAAELLPALRTSNDAFSDGVRMVRTAAMFSLIAQRGGRALVVTSGSPQEGKSTIASSLATLLTETGGRVLLIDADLRRPRAHEFFAAAAEPGLADYLAAGGHGDLNIRGTVVPGLDLLTAGAPQTASSALLGSTLMPALLDRLRGTYDWLILDSPPALALPDASILATYCNGTILVCSAETTRLRDAKAAVQQVTSIGGILIGAVLNQVDMARHSYYYGRAYSAYYGKPGDRPGAGDVEAGARPSHSGAPSITPAIAPSDASVGAPGPGRAAASVTTRPAPKIR